MDTQGTEAAEGRQWEEPPRSTRPRHEGDWQPRQEAGPQRAQPEQGTWWRPPEGRGNPEGEGKGGKERETRALLPLAWLDDLLVPAGGRAPRSRGLAAKQAAQQTAQGGQHQGRRVHREPHRGAAEQRPGPTAQAQRGPGQSRRAPQREAPLPVGAPEPPA